MGWSLAIHGGAGSILDSLTESHRIAVEESLQRIVKSGIVMLGDGQAALHVAEELVVQLEECECFNAGHGAVLSAAGKHELEAAIMDGATGRAGAACGLRTVRNPVRLARQILERTMHVFVGGEGAEDLARAWDLDRVPNEWFTTKRRMNQLTEFLAADPHDHMHHATVGAVVCDSKGDVAAATSTGGMTGKIPGRIGDAPLIGAGTWADSRMAVSCTGLGERFIRAGAARMLAARVELMNETLAESADAVLASMPPESGGLIAVHSDGDVVLPYTSEGMYRGWASEDGAFGFAIGEEARD